MFIVPSFVIGAVHGVVMAQAEHEAFEAQIEAMPEDLREGARNRRAKALKDAEKQRRHDELVEAAKSRNGGSVLPFLFGFMIGKS